MFIRSHSFLFVRHFRVPPCPYTQMHRSTPESVHPNPSMSLHVSPHPTCIIFGKYPVHTWHDHLVYPHHPFVSFLHSFPCSPVPIYTTVTIHIRACPSSQLIRVHPYIPQHTCISTFSPSKHDHLGSSKTIFAHFFVCTRTQPPHHTHPHTSPPIHTHIWPYFCVSRAYLHRACLVRVFACFDTVCLCIDFW